jgi:tetratricopeptide (TPR) repeat protein
MASAFQVLNVSQFSDLWGKSPSQIPLLRKIQPLEIKDTRTWQKMYKSSISSRELRRKGLYVRWVFMDDQLYRIRLGFKKKAPSFLSAFRRSIGRPPDKVFTDPWNIQESLWTDGDQRVLVGTKDSRVAFSIESKKLGIEAQARLDKVYQVENYHWQSQSRLYVKKDKFNIQEAERVNTLAVKEFPGFGDGWVNLCNIRYSLGDFADAIQYCDKARTVTQEQSVVAEADYFRGLIYFAQDDKYSGIAKLESALANRKVHHDLKKDSRLMLKGQRGDFSREVLKRAIKKYDQFAEKGLYKRASYVPKNFGAPSIEWLRRRY